MMADNAEVSNPGSSEKISRLDSWSVHRICSGQVIVSLAVAVKELVENALDAGAKDVVIRTKEYGCKLIEVQDDGDGILEENFEALCQKHYTSKLHEFSELENILTFGFRGEALSSLCALGDLSVTTKHESKTVGNVLKFNSEGLLTDSKPCARATGTTVTVENIFASLPVRHKQFVASLKKEFAKMVHFMSGYCLIARDVAISLVNIDERGKRNVVLKKRGHSTYKDNISEIFGYKETTKLLPFEQIPMSEDVKQEFGLCSVASEQFKEVDVVGFVSSCEHGSGRGSADRQFVFVNSRPCDFPKLTRMINSVYHQFNSSQHPFVMLNIVTPQHLVDVNLTPDKRMLLLQRENVILAAVKASLTAMFQKQATKYAVSNVAKIASFSSEEPLELEGDSPEEVVEERRCGYAGRREEKVLVSTTREDSVKPDIRERFAFKSQAGQSSLPTKRAREAVATVEVKPRLSLDAAPLSSFGFVRHLGKKPRLDTDPEQNTADSVGCNLSSLSQQNVSNEDEKQDKTAKLLKNARQKGESHGKRKSEPVHLLVRDAAEETVSEASTDASDAEEPEPNISAGEDLPLARDSPDRIVKVETDFSSIDSENEFVISDASKSSKIPRSPEDDLVLVLEDSEGRGIEENQAAENEDVLFVDEAAERKVGVHLLDWTEESMRQDFAKLEVIENSSDSAAEKEACNSRRFTARISPRENSRAESELMREITTDMFKQMAIIGQFNKGFIITKLNNDLFIVDQHAADEKFNFETLQATTVIECQPLAVPLKLFLAPGNEQVVVEHLAIFEKNGFRLSYDENAAYGKRLLLTAVPQSGQWAMGASDVDELVFMLNENYHPNLMNCRPSKVRAMFAMRACRKSVMVGHELKPRDMKRVVAQLSELQHPWNCPHGRPTMRHLVNLNLVHL